MEAVIGLDVHNSRALVAAMETLYASDDMSGQKATLWTAAYRGDSPSSHTVVVEYDSHEGLERGIAKRNASPDWARFVATVGSLSDVLSTRMAIQRRVDGSGWRDHGAMAAYSMSISDPGPIRQPLPT